MRSSLARRAAAAVLATAASRPAVAQMVGLPVVQAPFPGRSFAVALDGGSASDGLRTAGVAIAARAGASRLTGALGLGVVQGFARSHPSLGLRVAYLFPFGTSGALGVAPFAGAGSVSRGKDADPVAGDRPALPASVTMVPAGVSLGYRRLVAGRAVAVHVAPQVQLWRVGAGAGRDARSTSYGRVAVGADVALTRQLGIALGYEAGGSTSGANLSDGPRPGVFGLGVSYTPRRAGPPR